MERILQDYLTDWQQEKFALDCTTYTCKILSMEIGERIKNSREKVGISQSELARRVGVKPQAVQAWEAGRNGPSRKRIQAVAKELKISVLELEFGTTQELAGPSQKDSNVASFTIAGKIKFVPLVSWVTAGQWAEVSDNYPPGQGEDNIPCPSKCGPHSFALRVKGDSMEPEYPNGSVIIVDPDREPRHDADVVVRLNSDMEATFKRLKIDGPRWFLHPLNDRYPVIPLEGKDFTICGVVVWMGREVS